MTYSLELTETACSRSIQLNQREDCRDLFHASTNHKQHLLTEIPCVCGCVCVCVCVSVFVCMCLCVFLCVCE